MSEMTYRDAINLALKEEMRRDQSVVVFGEDVALYEGAFKVTRGLQIAVATRGLVELARQGGLNEQQLSGGTFSVSNLGRYGVSQFSAIIYPSQAAVLAVGAVSDAVVARAGVPVCARIMRLTLSADHRIVDGAYAAEFLAELKDALENPVRLLLS